MSNVVYGKDVIVGVFDGTEYVPVVCAVSCSYSIQNEIIGKTDVNAGYAPKRRVRQTDCSLSVSGLLTLENVPGEVSALWFIQEAVRRTEIPMRILFTDEAGVMKQITGVFLVETEEITADVSAFAEFNLNMVSTGPFTVVTVTAPSSPVPPVCEIETTLYGTLAEGQYIIHFDELQGDFTVLWVSREGLTHDQTTGLAGNRQFVYHSIVGNIEFSPLVPGNPGGEAVSVGYKRNT